MDETLKGEQVSVFLVVGDAARGADLAELFASVHLAARTFASEAELLAGVTSPDRGCIVADTSALEREVAGLPRRLARAHVHMPVIFLSVNDPVATAVAALRDGASDFLQRPVNDQLLLDVVNAAIESDRRSQREREEKRANLARFDRLTPREREVLEPLVRGLPSRRIADELGVSEKTVEAHRARVLRKTGAQTLPTLMRMALRAGLVEADAHLPANERP